MLGAVLVIVLLAAVGYAARPSGGASPSAAPATTGADPGTGTPAGTPAPGEPVGAGQNGTVTPSRTPRTATPTASPTPSTSGRATARPTPPRRRPTQSAWTAGVGYRPGDKVTHQGTRYVCRQAHTSQADWQPQHTPTLWRPA
ncbi:hypothetical protein OHR68_14195 [Spirillospora sp. NBC_00431]